MTALFWISALVIPFLLHFFFVWFIARQFTNMTDSLLSDLDVYGFPVQAADKMQLVASLSRKRLIYYTLLIINALLLHLIPHIGRVIFYLSSAFLMFLWIGACFALSCAKHAYRRIRKLFRLYYAPIVRCYRIISLYAFLLYATFVAFFDIVFLK